MSDRGGDGEQVIPAGMPRMNQLEPGDVLADGRTVVEVWSLGAYSAQAPRLTTAELDDGDHIVRKNWQRIKVIAPPSRGGHGEGER